MNATAFKETTLWGHMRTLLQTHAVSDFILEPQQCITYLLRGEVTRTAHRIELADWNIFVSTIKTRLTIEEGPLTHLDVALALDKYRFRISLFAHGGQERAIMRLLSTNIPKPADINMPVKLKEKGVLIRQGLVLITGPTGSGKSTTIASLLQERGTQRTEHILTLEDPIEFVYPTDLKALFTQREIGTDEPSYEMGLKAALRQAPHVILVGEIRDPESAEIALQAAETGHLVVSTFHTGSVVQTIQRFLQLIPPSRLGFATAILAETLEIVLVQRLISIQNNTKRLAIHEMMIKNTATANSIRSLGWNNLQTELDYGQDRGQLTFTRSVELARSKALITDTEASVILDLLKHKG